MVCTPAEAKDAVYVVDPFEPRVTDVVDPPLLYVVPAPSRVRLTFPVGFPDPLASATVMVTASLAFVFGEVVTAASVVVVDIRVVLLDGPTPTRFARSTDRSPVTSS